MSGVAQSKKGTGIRRDVTIGFPVRLRDPDGGYQAS